MNALTRHISVCVISVAALVSSCTRVGEPDSIFDDSPPVAVVAGKAISGEEYRRTYVDYLLDTGLPDAPERREAFLRRMVNVSLIAERERSAGIERTDAYRERARLVSSRLLVDSFVERQIYAQIEITEEDLKEMFVRANTEMTVRHLYARTIEDAERLRARLQAGETFERLAEEVFNDPKLAASGGLVGPFGFDEMDPAFEEAAFSLARGTVSEPVRTANGYSILRVEERITKPLLTETEFAERRDRLEAQVAFRRKARARADYIAGLMTALDPVFASNTLEALAVQLLTGRPAEAETLSDQDTLVRMRGGDEAWTIGDFREAAELVSEEQIARIRTPRDLTTFVEGLLAREEMIRRARRSGLDESPKYRAAFRAEMDRWVYDRAYTSIVEAIDVPEDTVRGYWEEFGAELMTDPMVDVREIVVSGAGARERVSKELEILPFEEVAGRFTIRADERGERGGVVRMTREQLGLFADRAFEADEGEVIGPQDVAGATVWLQVVHHVPPRPMTLEEAAPRIERMIRWSRRQDALRTAADAVRGSVSVSTWPERVLALELSERPGTTKPDVSTSAFHPTAAEAVPVSPKPRDIGS